MHRTLTLTPRPDLRRAGTSRRGFSLVELLVLVGIVVILISIFVPYVWKVQEDNRRVRCADNLRTIALAFTQYADANPRGYPRVRSATVAAPPPATAPASTQPATTNPVTLGPGSLVPSATPTTWPAPAVPT